MFVTLQIQEPVVMARLQSQAAALQVSVEELLHRFIDTQWGSATQNGVKDQDEDDGWVDEWAEEDDQVVIAAQEKFMLELEQEMAEMSAEIRREYGTGSDLVYNTVGMIDTGLSEEEMRYIIESPELSQQSLWLDTHLERV